METKLILGEKEIRNLRAAIIRQAIEDWRSLYRFNAQSKIVEDTGTTTKIRKTHGITELDFSFGEIRNFMNNYGELYTDMNIEKMMNTLEEELARCEKFRKKRESKMVERGYGRYKSK